MLTRRVQGAVLLDAACVPLTSWAFEAVLVLFGGQWPARGLLSGRWPPLCGEQAQGAGAPATHADAAVRGGSGNGAQARPGGRAPKQAGSQYSVMVHCASIRQLARLVSLQASVAARGRRPPCRERWFSHNGCAGQQRPRGHVRQHMHVAAQPLFTLLYTRGQHSTMFLPAPPPAAPTCVLH